MVIFDVGLVTAKSEGGPTDQEPVGPNETSESDATALAELVDLGHRVMQGQLIVSQEQNTKARLLLILSGGVLVVAVAMGGFIAGRPLGSFLGAPDLGVIGLLGFFSASFLSALTAFWFFIGALVGGTQRRPKGLHLGWNPENLLKAARKDTLTDVRLATLYGYQHWIPKNKATLNSANRRLWNGRWFLIAAGILLSAALIYSLGAIIQ